MLQVSEQAEGLLDAIIASNYISKKEHILDRYHFFLKNLKHPSPEIAIMLTIKHTQTNVNPQKLLEYYEYFVDELRVKEV